MTQSCKAHVTHDSAGPHQDSAGPRHDFTVADPHLALDSTHAGFTVTSIEALPELSATAYIMRHNASGARLMWIACADENKSFSIAFKTAPEDSTGVFHILEHSVLCGSDRFPVKEPFVNLLKSSMQTFLNALTFPDKTMYPVASTNVADLENLMDVYLDAVFHPAIYTRPRIFEQEGWHLELDSKDDDLRYNGVVFNEMKGALSDPDDVMFQALSAALFPDTAYHFESGGNPRDIPSLSYERFLDTHARHYRLDNSYTILYGDLDIDRELDFIGKRFDAAQPRSDKASNPLTYQQPIQAGLSSVTMATSPENASVGLAYVIGDACDREKVLAADILLDALCGSNEAPLKRALLDAQLGDDLVATLIDGELQPQIMLQLKGARPHVAERFIELVTTTCARMAQEGIDKDRLEASLAQAAFNLREGDWGSYGDGVALSIQAMNSWLYNDDHPVDYLRYQTAIDHMYAQINHGYFESLLQSLIVDSKHNAAVELIPAADDADWETQQLAERKAAMSESELDILIDELAALRAEQEAPDDPADIAKLPKLSVQDIGEAPFEEPVHMVEAPLPCLYHNLPTHRIAYVYHYFDLRRLHFEELPYVSILTTLLGKLDTKSMSASDLDIYVEKNLGNLDFLHESYGKDDEPWDVKPMLIVSSSALSEHLNALAKIPALVWSQTSFDDDERILALLAQQRILLEQNFVNAGHACAVARATSKLNAVSLVSDNMSGVSYYLFLKDILAHWDSKKDELKAKLSELCTRIFTADELTVSFTGSEEDLHAYWKHAQSFGLPQTDQVPQHLLKIEPPFAQNEAFIIPSNVGFVARISSEGKPDYQSMGSWQLAQRVLSLDYLWNEVRVKGGAYGVAFRRTNAGHHVFWSYRDPHIDETLKRYEGAAAWLQAWKCSQDDLDGYIVASVASLDAPMKSRSRARTQDALYFAQRPKDWKEIIRTQVLAVTPELLHQRAETLKQSTIDPLVCVFGPQTTIEASSLNFDSVIDLMGQGDVSQA